MSESNCNRDDRDDRDDRDVTIVYVDRIVYSTYTEAQKRACKKWYLSNKERICSKQRENYHSKKNSKKVSES